MSDLGPEVLAKFFYDACDEAEFGEIDPGWFRGVANFEDNDPDVGEEWMLDVRGLRDVLRRVCHKIKQMEGVVE